jgi:hypothetical protein
MTTTATAPSSLIGDLALTRLLAALTSGKR